MIENQNAYPMNLLVTLDRNYVPQLNVMLFSALQSDPAAFFDVYILHDEGLSASDLTATRALLGQRGALHLIRVDESGLTDAPTSDRYPKAIYYRIFAAKYLPHTLDRVLYLDPDLVVRKVCGRYMNCLWTQPSLPRPPTSGPFCTVSTNCASAWERMIPISTPASC